MLNCKMLTTVGISSFERLRCRVQLNAQSVLVFERVAHR